MIWLLRKENHHEKSNAVRAPRPAADPRRDEARRPVHDHVEWQAEDGHAPQAWRRAQQVPAAPELARDRAALPRDVWR